MIRATLSAQRLAHRARRCRFPPVSSTTGETDTTPCDSFRSQSNTGGNRRRPLSTNPRPSPDPFRLPLSREAAPGVSSRERWGKPLRPNPLSLIFTDDWRRFVLDPLSSVPSSARESEERWNFRAGVLAEAKAKAKAKASSARLSSSVEASGATKEAADELSSEREERGSVVPSSSFEAEDGREAPVANGANGISTTASAENDAPSSDDRLPDDEVGANEDASAAASTPSEGEDIESAADRFEWGSRPRSDRGGYGRPPPRQFEERDEHQHHGGHRPSSKWGDRRRPENRRHDDHRDKRLDNRRHEDDRARPRRQHRSPEQVASGIVGIVDRAVASDEFDAEGAFVTKLGRADPREAMELFHSCDAPLPLPAEVLGELCRRLPPERFLDKYDVFRGYVELAEREHEEIAGRSGTRGPESASAVAASPDSRSDSHGSDVDANVEVGGYEAELEAGTDISEVAEEERPAAVDDDDVNAYPLDSLVVFDLCDSLSHWAINHHNIWVYGARHKHEMTPRERYHRLSTAHDEGNRVRTALRWTWRLLGHLDEVAYQHRCVPRLAAGAVLLAQQSKEGGRSPDPDMWHTVADMIDACSMRGREFPLGDGGEGSAAESYLMVLNRAAVRREAQAVRFHKVLKVLVRDGHAVDPAVAIGLLRSLYPFHHAETGECGFTESVLSSIARLQQMQFEEAESSAIAKEAEGDADAAPSMRMVSDYCIDIGTLEHIVAGAGISGGSRMAQLAWDVADGCGLDPSTSEAMYEGTIMAFFNSKNKEDQVAFAVLADMESKGGFVPSRALLHEMGRRIGLSTGRLDNAYYILTVNDTDGVAITSSSLNTILAGCARLGDADRGFSTAEDFDRFGVDLTWDSLVFLMEALAEDGALCAHDAYHKETGHRHENAPRGAFMASQNSKWDDETRLAKAAEVMLVADEWQNGDGNGGRDVAGEQRCPPGGSDAKSPGARSAQRTILHHYVRILCGAGEMEGAREVLELAAVGDATGAGVSPESFAILATKYARAGDFESAKDVMLRLPEEAGYGDLIPPFLTRRIEKMEETGEGLRVGTENRGWRGVSRSSGDRSQGL